MPDRVVIVGGLPQRQDRTALLSMLSQRQPEILWDWIQPINEQFSLPVNPFNRLLHDLRTARPDSERLLVVKLAHLHGKEANQLYRAYSNPLLPPRELASSEQLTEWLLSPDTGIVPKREWSLSVREVGLVTLLSKLIRNKSWNKDGHGHAWTREDDLLGQAPVMRPDFPAVYGEAAACLEHACGGLLLTKGGKQGATRKEWSINTAHLSAVKRAMLERSLNPLRSEPALRALMEYVDRGPTVLVQIDGVIISERVLAICRDRDEKG